MFKRFLSVRSGNFGAMFAIFLVPLLACIGMAIDYSNIVNHRVKLQNAADAAVIMAGKKLQDSGALPSQSDVEDFIEANYSRGFSVASYNRSGTLIGTNLTLIVHTQT